MFGCCGLVGCVSTVDIDSYFEKEIQATTKKSFCVRVQLHQPARTREGKLLSSFLVQAFESGFCLHEEECNDAPTVDASWTPKSHMRDFEWIHFPELAEPHFVARGQGIGILIIESLQIYIKLIYDSSSPLGVRDVGQLSPLWERCPVTDGWTCEGGGMLWSHSAAAKRLLHMDLHIGYDVFLVSDAIHQLCESLDQRDARETLILFPQYAPYAHYQHPTL